MAKRKITKSKENRKQKFIELVAQNVTPYQAALQAGYAKATAKNKSQDMVEKWLPEIEKLKPVVQEAIEEEFKYSVKDSFKKLCEIQELALLPDEEGNYRNLTAATKAEELKGKMYGVYEADNKQKTNPSPQIVVASQSDANLIKEVQNVKPDENIL